jgi:hypothetical protein
MACHPSRPLVALLSIDGTLQVWNYDMKLLMNLRSFGDKDKSAGQPPVTNGRLLGATSAGTGHHGTKKINTVR